MFVEFQSPTGGKRFISPIHISALVADAGYTVLSLNSGGRWNIKGTPEEVAYLLKGKVPLVEFNSTGKKLFVNPHHVSVIYLDGALDGATVLCLNNNSKYTVTASPDEAVRKLEGRG